VNIGQVTAVRLSPDYSKVEVTAKIAKTAAGLIVEDAKFWVVEPRVTLSGVSGLGTLLSGNYIGFEVGKSSKKQRTFTGLETPPIITYGQPGRQFVLKAKSLGSLGIGSPVYYRSLQAGQVVAYELARDGKGLDITIFVNAPYEQYVNSGTRFWNASGIDVSLGANGVEVRTESLVALIAGGLAFDTSPVATTIEPAPADATFTLHADRAAAMKEPDTIAARYVLYFNETLRGLSVGAPLTLLGLPAGEVTEIGLDIDPRPRAFAGAWRSSPTPAPHRAPGRPGKRPWASSLTQSAAQRHALIQELVEQRGVRAQLRSGNLLTGQLFVALDYFPGRAQGEDRLDAARAGAAGGAEHPPGPRGEAQRHPRQARPAAARGDRRRRHQGAGLARQHAEGREQAPE
jgi:paraquat-inducible protein B